jgi:predicted ATP-binding protein involved in virulence
MPLFLLNRVVATNYRCFELLDLELDPELTVIFARNGGGKSLALRALAVAAAGWLPNLPAALWSAGAQKPDLRVVYTPGGAFEPAGPATLAVEGTVAGEPVPWHLDLRPDDSKVRTAGLAELKTARRRVLVPGAAWPVLAWYGTQRLWGQVKNSEKKRANTRRAAGYADCLDPRATEGPTLEWLASESEADGLARLDGRPQRGFAAAVFAAMQRATPDLLGLRYDHARREIIAELDGVGAVPWSQLSDGYHVFLGLVGDVARRAVQLNDHLGPKAVGGAQGLLLIDEVDLHLHPTWQRRVLTGLRAAFPTMQLVVSTHAPLVLAGARNHQVRLLEGFAVVDRPHFVRGRDASTLLREAFGAQPRPAWGVEREAEVTAAIDRGDRLRALGLLDALRLEWGEHAPELAFYDALLWEDAPEPPAVPDRSDPSIADGAASVDEGRA